MTKWSYAMHGAPEGEPTNVREADEPGPVFMCERLREPGVYDLYALLGFNETFRTATYEHRKSGTYTEVVAAVLEETGVEFR
jgi:hypothetical protein